VQDYLCLKKGQNTNLKTVLQRRNCLTKLTSTSWESNPRVHWLCFSSMKVAKLSFCTLNSSSEKNVKWIFLKVYRNLLLLLMQTYKKFVYAASTWCNVGKSYRLLFSLVQQQLVEVGLLVPYKEDIF
jgi:hypothetical protein